MEGSFRIEENDYPFVTLSEEESEGMGMIVAVDEDADDAAVTDAIRRTAREKIWHLDPEIQAAPLREVVQVVLEPELSVAVYNFMDRALTPQENGRLAAALLHYWASLRDRERWRVMSVLIRREQPVNRTSGEVQYGSGYAARRCFELFPAALSEAPYRGIAGWDTLTAVVQHEATHVCIEQALADLWYEHAERLGWELTPPGRFLALPGGVETRMFQRRPEECPTPYAALLPEEDRCESAAAYLGCRGRLNDVRRELTAVYFQPEPRRTINPAWNMLRPELPRLSLPLPVRLTRGRFTPIGLITPDVPVEITTVPLDQYRAQLEAR